MLRRSSPKSSRDTMQPPPDHDLAAPTAITTTALTRQFSGFTAVDAIDLNIAKGSIHALVGPNGAGKTTLFNLLTGFLHPTSGTIHLGQEDITGSAPESIVHRGVARSFQITSLFDDMTPVEHLELSLQNLDGHGYAFWRSGKILKQYDARAMELLQYVGLADLRRQKVGSLAYGQKRALELAVALSLKPTVLLLDEPTAGMGAEDIDRTIELVQQVAEDRTVVFVDHNMHVVSSLADRVTVMQQGKILAEGSYESVRADPRVVTAYLGGAHA